MDDERPRSLGYERISAQMAVVVGHWHRNRHRDAFVAYVVVAVVGIEDVVVVVVVDSVVAGDSPCLQGVVEWIVDQMGCSLIDCIFELSGIGLWVIVAVG